MVFEPVTEEQRKHFFRQGYSSHLPGYTGHCPTLKFRVGKRYGACTEEIMKELIEKKILKAGPYKPNSNKEIVVPIPREKDITCDWKKDSCVYKSPPYILGYTGYIPGYSSRYGLTFMKAVEEGAIEWREVQSKLKERRDTMRAHAERMDPQNMLSHVKTEKMEIDHGYSRKRQYFDNQVSAESPPIVGYTGHIPGAKGEVALSKRYAQAAKKGLELLQKERQTRHDAVSKADAVHRVLETAHLEDSGYEKA